MLKLRRIKSKATKKKAEKIIKLKELVDKKK